jgi:hypothetical protein
MTTLLPQSEIATITGKKRPSAQVAALRKLGIPFKQTVQGSPIVSTASLEKWLGNDTGTEKASVNKGFLNA